VGIAVSLNEDVNHIPILVNGSPEVVTLASYSHEHFVQVPDIAISALATSEVPSVVRPEHPTPLTYSLVGDESTAFRKEVLDISEAQ
jgi:hypothetical protein